MRGGPQCHRLLGWHRDTWVQSSGAVPGGMQGASWASGKKNSSILCLQLSLCLLLPAAAFKPSRAPSPITTLQ